MSFSRFSTSVIDLFQKIKKTSVIDVSLCILSPSWRFGVEWEGGEIDISLCFQLGVGFACMCTIWGGVPLCLL